MITKTETLTERYLRNWYNANEERLDIIPVPQNNAALTKAEEITEDAFKTLMEQNKKTGHSFTGKLATAFNNAYRYHNYLRRMVPQPDVSELEQELEVMNRLKVELIDEYEIYKQLKIREPNETKVPPITTTGPCKHWY